MGAPLRIAILECDEPAGAKARSKCGGFGNLFRALFENATLEIACTAPHEPPLQVFVTAYDVLNGFEYPRLETVDAVLLTGSRYDSYTNGKDDWILRLVEFVVKLLHEQTRVRVLGVCFGHQIIGRALGVMPSRNEKGWEVSVTKVELTRKGQRVFGLDSLMVHEMHRDELPACPAGVECLGWTKHSPVQGLYSKGRLMSLQGHPEYYGELAEELLDLRGPTIFEEKVYLDGKNRVHCAHDGPIIAASFLNFLVDP